MAELRLFLGKDGYILDVSGGYQISYGVHIDLNLVDLAELIEGQGRDSQQVADNLMLRMINLQPRFNSSRLLSSNLVHELHPLSPTVNQGPLHRHPPPVSLLL